MKKLLIIPVLTIIILSLGCKRNDKQTVQQDNSAIDTLHQEYQEDQAGGEEVTGKLVLDNGNKWQSNPETTEGIHKMQALVDAYLSKGSNDNKMLSENLDKEFNTVIQKCTMTGKAHDQLHLFLLPLKDKFNKLKENQDVSAVKEIQSYLNDYENYFQ